MAHIFASIKESLSSVLPIALIVILLSITCVALDAGVLVLFLFGTLLLILGMSFFTVGSGISMEPLGDGIGKSLNKKKWILIPLIICFVLGFLITVSEPDLTVLAEQVPTIPNALLINCVGIGVGAFLAITLIRNRKEIPLRRLLVIFYAVVIALAFFAPKDFIPTAFDSGGVTTGPITVPFIMALGAGLAAAKKGKNTGGTVIKGRLADIQQFAEFVDAKVDADREMLCILAPAKASKAIMEEVNRTFGLTSEANGMIFALPTEKAFKI